jgi:hypothetical protein
LNANTRENCWRNRQNQDKYVIVNKPVRVYFFWKIKYNKGKRNVDKSRNEDL